MPTVAFDAVGTLFSLDAPRRALRDAGAPSYATELWFAQGLRDFFALSHAGGYRPLDDVLAAELPRTFRAVGIRPDARLMEAPLASLKRLRPRPGAVEAVRALHDVGVRVLVVTNGSRKVTERLLRRARLTDAVDEVVSADDLRTSKPDRRVYETVRAHSVGVTWLVSAHAWDCMGATRAGLRSVWVSSAEREWLAAYPDPGERADDVRGAVDLILPQLARCEEPETLLLAPPAEA